MASDATVGCGAPHVVIIGAGFGGLAAAKGLRSAAAQVTIVDRRNHHLFQPLLYQVATAALNPSDIAQPIRRILRRQRNVSVALGEATGVDLAARKVVLREEEELQFDYLILATGATHSYFGHDNWEHSAPGLKTVEDALEIRRRVLVAYEAAERESNPAIQREWLTFVIVGAGPTGVEMAGALAEISRRVLSLDFRRIEPCRARIVLIEAAVRVLPAMSPESSANAYRQLVRRGVATRALARHAAGPGRASRGRVRSDAQGRAACVHHRRSRCVAAGRKAGAWSRCGRDAGRPACGAQHRSFDSRRDARAVPLHRQKYPGDRRSRRRGYRLRVDSSERIGGVGVVAGRPHLLFNRFSKSRAGAYRMGVGLSAQRARRAANHGRGRATHRKRRASRGAVTRSNG